MRFILSLFSISIFFLIGIFNHLKIIDDIQYYYFFFVIFNLIGLVFTRNYSPITTQQNGFFKYIYAFWIVLLIIVHFIY
jgi:hypothetical protein